jgi:protease IV
MKEPQENLSISARIFQAPIKAFRWLVFALRRGFVLLRNRIRKIRRLQIDYVVLPVSGNLPERSAPPPGFIERWLPFRSAELSLQELNGNLQKIADADNVKGVLFIFQGFQAGLASLENLRRAIQRLREAGKEVVVYTPYLDLRHYYVAAAADRIFAPPGAQFDVLGLHAEVLFLKDALQQIGVQVDVVQISPYKTAMDMLQHAQMTPEYKAQINWLLDDQFDTLTAAMGSGRGLSQEEMKALIDEAPFMAEKAKEKGLLDDLAYEDELAKLLAIPNLDQNEQSTINARQSDLITESKKNGEGDPEKEDKGQPEAILKTWPEVRKQLLEKPRRSSRRFVGVVSLNGLITMGPSRRLPVDLPIPLVGGATAGEQTLLSLLRQAERMGSLAALIFHVDSGGGSALASELITRQIQRIGQKIPVLAYMGNVAASGGYYVSACAAHIMSQESTMTGSIGVISGRPSTSELLEKIKVNRVGLNRGRNAGLYFDQAPMTAEERQIFWETIVHSYDQFKQEVAAGRDLPFDELDPICEGRVWTGRQAREHRLVDSHGDFVDAIYKAADMAGLPYGDNHQIRVVNLYSKKDGYLLPRPYEAAQEIERLLSRKWVRELSGRPMLMMPFSINID